MLKLIKLGAVDFYSAFASSNHLAILGGNGG